MSKSGTEGWLADSKGRSELGTQAEGKCWRAMRATENSLAMSECGAGVYILGLIAVDELLVC